MDDGFAGKMSALCCKIYIVVEIPKSVPFERAKTSSLAGKTLPGMLLI